MADRYSFGGVHLDMDPERQRAYEKPSPETPFRVAILGDFSGRASREIVEPGPRLAARKAIEVDVDNFEDLMTRLKVELDVPVAGAIRFRELDDFHPDNLYSNLSFFSAVRQTASAASSGRPAARPAPKPVPAAPPAKPEDLARGNLLDQAMEETSTRAEGRAAIERDEFRSLLDRVVAPHLEAREAPDAATRRALVAQAASVQMRALMHFPPFQALEAAWRSLFFLLRRVETDETIKLYVIDVSKEELAADLAGVSDPRESGIGELLLRSSEDVLGGEPWGVLIGNYTFGTEKADPQTLAKMGTLCASLGAPFVAGAAAALLGSSGLVESPDPRRWNQPLDAGWKDLRRSAEARWIGLALPRFLLRVPYGRKSDACERFAYEEMPDPVEHERYLWGNAAFACAALLGISFRERGWEFKPGMYLNIGRLPVDVRERDGEPVAQPCAEVLMTERAAQAILDAGVMPLATLKGTDEVRLVRFQSIASPPAALSGRWASGSTYTVPPEETCEDRDAAPEEPGGGAETAAAGEWPSSDDTPAETPAEAASGFDFPNEDDPPRESGF